MSEPASPDLKGTTHSLYNMWILRFRKSFRIFSKKTCISSVVNFNTCVQSLRVNPLSPTSSWIRFQQSTIFYVSVNRFIDVRMLFTTTFEPHVWILVKHLSNVCLLTKIQLRPAFPCARYSQIQHLSDVLPILGPNKSRAQSWHRLLLTFCFIRTWRGRLLWIHLRSHKCNQSLETPLNYQARYFRNTVELISTSPQ